MVKKSLSRVIVPIILALLSSAVMLEIHLSEEDVAQEPYEISSFEYTNGVFAGVVGASFVLLVLIFSERGKHGADDTLLTPTLLKVIAASIVYIVAVPTVGFYISTFLFAAYTFMLLYRGRHPLIKAAIYSGCLLLVLYPVIESFNLYLPEAFLF